MIKKGDEVIIVFPATVSYRMATYTGERQDSISIKKLVCTLIPDGKRYAAQEQNVYPSVPFNKDLVSLVDAKRKAAQEAKSDAMDALSSLKKKPIGKCDKCGFSYYQRSELEESRPYGHNRGYIEYKCPSCSNVLDTKDSTD